MDIETIKNELKEHILDSVQEDAKNATIYWLDTTVLPAAKWRMPTQPPCRNLPVRKPAGISSAINAFCRR